MVLDEMVQEPKDEIHLKLVLWFGLGFGSGPFSGLFLIRRTGKGLENWTLEGMYSNWQPAVTSLSSNLVESPLTSHGEIPEQRKSD